MARRERPKVPRRQCTGTSKQSGKRCLNRPKVGWEVCHIHGGKSKRGIASPTFKHGKYSKDMPTDLRERYEELRAEEDLLVLDENIAVMQALIAHTLASLSRGEGSGRTWAKLVETWDKYEAGRLLARIDPGMAAIEQQNAIDEIGRLIKQGASDAGAMLQVEHQSLTLGKLVDLEGKRRERERQTVTVERALILVQAIADSVRRNVRDERALTIIAADILAVTGGSVRALSLAEPVKE